MASSADAQPRRVPVGPPDRELPRQAFSELSLLVRCLDLDDRLRAWDDVADVVSGVVAADALDQARELVEELASSGAEALLLVVVRIASALPPPME